MSPSPTGESSVLGGSCYGYMGVLDSFAAALSINIIMTHHVTHMSAYGNVSPRCVLLCLYQFWLDFGVLNLQLPPVIDIGRSTAVNPIPAVVSSGKLTS